MKVTYEFNTNDENFDPSELRLYQQANNLYCALFEIQQRVHGWAKYGSFPKLGKQDPIDYLPGSEERCKEINEFIKKHDIPDIYAIEDEINEILLDNKVDLD